MKAMQRFALFLALLYTTAITGLAFDLHYCGGKLDSINLFTATSSCKMCSEMAALEKENSCCKDAKVEVKVKDNHHAAAKVVLFKLIEVVVAPFALTYKPLEPISGAVAYKYIEAPPRLSNQPIYILNCVFRI